MLIARRTFDVFCRSYRPDAIKTLILGLAPQATIFHASGAFENHDRSGFNFVGFGPPYPYPYWYPWYPGYLWYPYWWY